MASDWDSAAGKSGESDEAEHAVQPGHAASPGASATSDPATDAPPVRQRRVGGPHLAAWARLIRVLRHRWGQQAQRIRGLQRH